MAMLYDVAQALKGAKTDGQSKTAAGGSSSSVSVRHGTVQTVSGKWAEVLLDGSDEPVNVSCETSPVAEQRVSVVKQGGVCKVVTLGKLPERLDLAQAAIGYNAQALADEVQTRKDAVSDARKVAENFIAQDSTGALTIADMNTAAADRNSVVVDAYGMRVQEGGEDIAVFGEVTTLGKETDFHVDLSSKGMQLFDKTDTLCGTVAEYSTDGSTVSGLLVKAEDWDKNIVLDVPTATEGIESQVIVSGDGVYAGRNEAHAYIGYSGENAVATATATSDVTVTSAGGSIKANAYMGGLKCNTGAGLFEISTSATTGITAAAGAALETSGGTIGLVSYPSTATNKGAQLYLQNSGTAKLIVSPTSGARLEATVSGNKITLNCTSGVIANDVETIPSTAYSACRLLTFGPVNILVVNGQSIGTTAWTAGTHIMFTLPKYRRPGILTANTLMVSASQVCRIQITTAGVVSVICGSTLAASTKLYGQLMWIATQ